MLNEIDIINILGDEASHSGTEAKLLPEWALFKTRLSKLYDCYTHAGLTDHELAVHKLTLQIPDLQEVFVVPARLAKLSSLPVVMVENEDGEKEEYDPVNDYFKEDPELEAQVSYISELQKKLIIMVQDQIISDAEQNRINSNGFAD